jgi:Tol biopolymer transport system component/DNA-binding winged helix-turn-helix (wHTH) protein
VEGTLHNGRLVRFGVFEVDLRSGELRKAGAKLKIRGQPFQVLAILLENPGEIVTREDLLKRLWPNTFVDGDHNLNTAINKIREVLGDSAENPRFVETLPRRGYRFIAPVEGTRPAMPPAPVSTPRVPEVRSVRWGVLRTGVLIGAIVLIAIAGLFLYRLHRVSEPVVQQHALTRLTSDEGLQTGATWSPDGRFIAYASDHGGKFDIWVQQVSGGNPVQVTKGPGHHWQPNWSPDGKYIAYRSEEGDGGIYIIPALGGAGLERKIAAFGYYPSWSPDSQQILFQKEMGYHFYVARLDGSPPREVLSEFPAQKKRMPASAAWYPDGKRITVIWAGSSSPTPSFWTVPLDGGLGVELEIPPAVRKRLAEASGETKPGLLLGEYLFCWAPSGSALYFERVYSGAENIWKLTVDPETMRATGVERLTTGAGPDTAPAISADGRRLAFTAKSQRVQTWLFPFNARTGQIQATGTAITSPGRISLVPDLSRDGKKVAFMVARGETLWSTIGDVRNEIWVKFLVDGGETPLFSDDHSRWYPRWSPDGRQLAYVRQKRGASEPQLMLWSSQTHEEVPLTGVTSQQLMSLVYDWSPDGKWLLTTEGNGAAVWLVPVAPAPQPEASARRIAFNPAYELYQPHMSPDGRWIVFLADSAANSPANESSLFVIPASGGAWTRITDGRHKDDKPRWSPDGKTIYFVSNPGGFFNVWGIRFDSAAGKPIGQPFQVSKFDSPRLMILRMITPVELSLTQDKLALTMEQASGNVWFLDNVDR